MKHLQKILLVIAIGMFMSCAEQEKQQAQPKRPVKYEEVGYLGGGKLQTFSGTAQTDKVIKLSFRNSGIITQFDIKLGQKVKKGQLLGKLDNVSSRLAYEQSVTQVNSAESQVNTAKLSLDRVRILYEKGSSSLSDFEAAKNSYKTALESFESSKRGLAIQQEKINYGYLYAPEEGTISTVNVEIDENVSPGQLIATLNSGTDMEITLGIPESVINGVKNGMNVLVDFSSIVNKKFKATVTEVSPAVSSNTATYPVRVTLDEPSDVIKSGMTANVTFNFGNQKTNNKTLVVPSNAVGEDNNGRFVFLIEGEKDNVRVKKQTINIGALTSEGFEVISGLTAGQKIATAGLQTLLNGQEVRLY
jgi:RND family efflux transporter MFP subunit